MKGTPKRLLAAKFVGLGSETLSAETLSAGNI